jgi:hypothetical protein
MLFSKTVSLGNLLVSVHWSDSLQNRLFGVILRRRHVAFPSKISQCSLGSLTGQSGPLIAISMSVGGGNRHPKIPGKSCTDRRRSTVNSVQCTSFSAYPFNSSLKEVLAGKHPKAPVFLCFSFTVLKK